MNQTIQPIDTFAKGKGHPPVPEASDYGLIFISISLMVLFFKRAYAHDQARIQKAQRES